MTMRNYVQCVQRSVQDSNPLGVTNLHTLQNQVSHTWCIRYRNRLLPTGRYVE